MLRERERDIYYLNKFILKTLKINVLLSLKASALAGRGVTAA
jgi:hypothetical protein